MERKASEDGEVAMDARAKKVAVVVETGVTTRNSQEKTRVTLEPQHSKEKEALVTLTRVT